MYMQYHVNMTLQENADITRRADVTRECIMQPFKKKSKTLKEKIQDW